MVVGDGSWNCFCGWFVSALFFHPWAKVASSTLGFLLAGHSRVQEWECSVRFAALYDFSASTKTAISVKNKEFISPGSFSIHHFHIKKIKEFGLGGLCQILVYVSQAQSSHCSQIHNRGFPTSVFVDVSFRFEWFARCFGEKKTHAAAGCAASVTSIYGLCLFVWMIPCPLCASKSSVDTAMGKLQRRISSPRQTVFDAFHARIIAEKDSRVVCKSLVCDIHM